MDCPYKPERSAPFLNEFGEPHLGTIIGTSIGTGMGTPLRTYSGQSWGHTGPDMSGPSDSAIVCPM